MRRAWAVEHRFEATRLRIATLKRPTTWSALEYRSDKLAAVYRRVGGVHSNVVPTPDSRLEIRQNPRPCSDSK